jgi:hypothetical protein
MGDIILVRMQPPLPQEPRSGEIIKEDRNRRAENGMTEDGRRKAEIGERRSEVRRLKTEGG